jgi:hypothetical protein
MSMRSMSLSNVLRIPLDLEKLKGPKTQFVVVLNLYRVITCTPFPASQKQHQLVHDCFGT